MWVEGEPSVEGNAENLELDGNLDQGSGDVDKDGIMKCLSALGCA